MSLAQIINLSENSGFMKYKQEIPVPPGKYYVFKGKPTEAEKKIMEMIAVCPPNGGFLWLCTAEAWVKRYQTGQFFPTIPTIEPDWDMLKIDPNILRPWQRECVTEAYSYIMHRQQYRKGWIVSLGGGKTLAGLVLAQLYENPLVIVSKYLHATWQAEAQKWGLSCPKITTYESAHKCSGHDCLIIDESLALKNPQSQRGSAIRELAIQADMVVGFTGIATGGKGPFDFRWLRCVSPESVAHSEKSWQFQFGLDTKLTDVGPNKAYVTKKWDDQKITEWVSPFIRTVDTKALVAHLPELEERYIICPKPNQYDTIATGGATTRGSSKRIAQMRQASDGFITLDDDTIQLLSDHNQTKIDMVKDFVENLGESILIYSAWTHGVQLLGEAFADYKPSIVDGTIANPGAQIERFRAGETKILIANSMYSRGMNLQEVCRVIAFLSLSTRPDDLVQAIGRIYRPGQKHGCIIAYFCCEGTLDKRVIELVKMHGDKSSTFIEKLLEAENA